MDNPLFQQWIAANHPEYTQRSTDGGKTWQSIKPTAAPQQQSTAHEQEANYNKTVPEGYHIKNEVIDTAEKIKESEPEKHSFLADAIGGIDFRNYEGPQKWLAPIVQESTGRVISGVSKKSSGHLESESEEQTDQNTPQNNVAYSDQYKTMVSGFDTKNDKAVANWLMQDQDANLAAAQKEADTALESYKQAEAAYNSWLDECNAAINNSLSQIEALEAKHDQYTNPIYFSGYVDVNGKRVSGVSRHGDYEKIQADALQKQIDEANAEISKIYSDLDSGKIRSYQARARISPIQANVREWQTKLDALNESIANRPQKVEGVERPWTDEEIAEYNTLYDNYQSNYLYYSALLQDSPEKAALLDNMSMAFDNYSKAVANVDYQSDMMSYLGYNSEYRQQNTPNQEEWGILGAWFDKKSRLVEGSVGGTAMNMGLAGINFLRSFTGKVVNTTLDAKDLFKGELKEKSFAEKFLEAHLKAPDDYSKITLDEKGHVTKEDWDRLFKTNGKILEQNGLGTLDKFNAAIDSVNRDNYIVDVNKENINRMFRADNLRASKEYYDALVQSASYGTYGIEKFMNEVIPSVVNSGITFAMAPKVEKGAALIDRVYAMAPFAASAYGASYEEALKNGYSDDAAAAGALADTTIEIMAELIGGEAMLNVLGPGSGFLDDFTERLIAKMPEGVFQRLSFYILGAAVPEGIEEDFGVALGVIPEALKESIDNSDSNFFAELRKALQEQYEDPEAALNEYLHSFSTGAVAALLPTIGADVASKAVGTQGYVYNADGSQVFETDPITVENRGNKLYDLLGSNPASTKEVQIPKMTPREHKSFTERRLEDINAKASRNTRVEEKIEEGKTAEEAKAEVEAEDKAANEAYISSKINNVIKSAKDRIGNESIETQIEWADAREKLEDVISNMQTGDSVYSAGKKFGEVVDVSDYGVRILTDSGETKVILAESFADAETYNAFKNGVEIRSEETKQNGEQSTEEPAGPEQRVTEFTREAEDAESGEGASAVNAILDAVAEEGYSADSIEIAGEDIPSGTDERRTQTESDLGAEEEAEGTGPAVNNTITLPDGRVVEIPEGANRFTTDENGNVVQISGTEAARDSSGNRIIDNIVAPQKQKTVEAAPDFIYGNDEGSALQPESKAEPMPADSSYDFIYGQSGDVQTPAEPQQRPAVKKSVFVTSEEAQQTAESRRDLRQKLGALIAPVADRITPVPVSSLLQSSNGNKASVARTRVGTTDIYTLNARSIDDYTAADTRFSLVDGIVRRLNRHGENVSVVMCDSFVTREDGGEIDSDDVGETMFDEDGNITIFATDIHSLRHEVAHLMLYHANSVAREFTAGIHEFLENAFASSYGDDGAGLLTKAEEYVTNVGYTQEEADEEIFCELYSCLDENVDPKWATDNGISFIAIASAFKTNEYCVSFMRNLRIYSMQDISIDSIVNASRSKSSKFEGSISNEEYWGKVGEKYDNVKIAEERKTVPPRPSPEIKYNVEHKKAFVERRNADQIGADLNGNIEHDVSIIGNFFKKVANAFTFSDVFNRNSKQREAKRRAAEALEQNKRLISLLQNLPKDYYWAILNEVNKYYRTRDSLRRSERITQAKTDADLYLKGQRYKGFRESLNKKYKKGESWSSEDRRLNKELDLTPEEWKRYNEIESEKRQKGRQIIGIILFSEEGQAAKDFYGSGFTNADLADLGNALCELAGIDISGADSFEEVISKIFEAVYPEDNVLKGLSKGVFEDSRESVNAVSFGDINRGITDSDADIGSSEYDKDVRTQFLSDKAGALVIGELLESAKEYEEGSAEYNEIMAMAAKLSEIFQVIDSENTQRNALKASLAETIREEGGNDVDGADFFVQQALLRFLEIANDANITFGNKYLGKYYTSYYAGNKRKSISSDFLRAEKKCFYSAEQAESGDDISYWRRVILSQMNSSEYLFDSEGNYTPESNLTDEQLEKYWPYLKQFTDPVTGVLDFRLTNRFCTTPSDDMSMLAKAEMLNTLFPENSYHVTYDEESGHEIVESRLRRVREDVFANGTRESDYDGYSEHQLRKDVADTSSTFTDLNGNQIPLGGYKVRRLQDHKIDSESVDEYQAALNWTEDEVVVEASTMSIGRKILENEKKSLLRKIEKTKEYMARIAEVRNVKRTTNTLRRANSDMVEYRQALIEEKEARAKGERSRGMIDNSAEAKREFADEQIAKSSVASLFNNILGQKMKSDLWKELNNAIQLTGIGKNKSKAKAKDIAKRVRDEAMGISMFGLTEERMARIESVITSNGGYITEDFRLALESFIKNYSQVTKDAAKANELYRESANERIAENNAEVNAAEVRREHRNLAISNIEGLSRLLKPAVFGGIDFFSGQLNTDGRTATTDFLYNVFAGNKSRGVTEMNETVGDMTDAEIETEIEALDTLIKHFNDIVSVGDSLVYFETDKLVSFLYNEYNKFGEETPHVAKETKILKNCRQFFQAGEFVECADTFYKYLMESGITTWSVSATKAVTMDTIDILERNCSAQLISQQNDLRAIEAGTVTVRYGDFENLEKNIAEIESEIYGLNEQISASENSGNVLMFQGLSRKRDILQKQLDELKSQEDHIRKDTAVRNQRQTDYLNGKRLEPAESASSVAEASPEQKALLATQPAASASVPAEAAETVAEPVAQPPVKKPRKTRSDKGKPRGPRNKKDMGFSNREEAHGPDTWSGDGAKAEMEELKSKVDSNSKKLDSIISRLDRADAREAAKAEPQTEVPKTPSEPVVTNADVADAIASEHDTATVGEIAAMNREESRAKSELDETRRFGVNEAIKRLRKNFFRITRQITRPNAKNHVAAEFVKDLAKVCKDLDTALSGKELMANTEEEYRRMREKEDRRNRGEEPAVGAGISARIKAFNKLVEDNSLTSVTSNKEFMDGLKEIEKIVRRKPFASDWTVDELNKVVDNLNYMATIAQNTTFTEIEGRLVRTKDFRKQILDSMYEARGKSKLAGKIHDIAGRFVYGGDDAEVFFKRTLGVDMGRKVFDMFVKSGREGDSAKAFADDALAAIMFVLDDEGNATWEKSKRNHFSLDNREALKTLEHKAVNSNWEKRNDVVTIRGKDFEFECTRSELWSLMMHMRAGHNKMSLATGGFLIGNRDLLNKGLKDEAYSLKNATVVGRWAEAQTVKNLRKELTELRIELETVCSRIAATQNLGIGSLQMAYNRGDYFVETSLPREVIENNPEIANLVAQMDEKYDALEDARDALEEKLNAFEEALYTENESRTAADIEYDKSVIAAADEFFNRWREKINEASLAMFGYETANVLGTYMPMIVNSDYLTQVFVGGSSGDDGFRFNKPSYLQERNNVPSDKYSYCIGLDDVFASYGASSEKFVGIDKAVFAMQSVFGTADIEAGEKKLSEIFREVNGDSALSFYNNLIEDLTGSRKQSEDVFSSLRGTLGTSALSASPRIELSQAASYWIAASVLDSRSMRLGLALKSRRQIEQMYSEVLRDAAILDKRLGEDQVTELGKFGSSLKNGKPKSKLAQFRDGVGTILMRGITNQDYTTCLKLIAATDDYCSRHKGEMSKYGAETYEEFRAMKYAEVLNKTQPVSSSDALYSSGHRRSRSEIVRAMAMFSSQRSSSRNLLVDSALELKAAKKSGSKETIRNAKDRLARTSTFFLISNIQLSLIKAFTDLLINHDPDDDEDKETGDFTWSRLYRDSEGALRWDGFLKNVTMMTADSVFSIGFGTQEILDLVDSLVDPTNTYYSPTISGMSSLEDFIEAVIKYRALSSKTYANSKLKEEARKKAILNLAASAGSLTGFGVNNLYKLGLGVSRTVDWAESAFIYGLGNGKRWDDYGEDRTSKQAANILWNAYKSGEDPLESIDFQRGSEYLGVYAEQTQANSLKERIGRDVSADMSDEEYLSMIDDAADFYLSSHISTSPTKARDKALNTIYYYANGGCNIGDMIKDYVGDENGVRKLPDRDIFIRNNIVFGGKTEREALNLAELCDLQIDFGTDSRNWGDEFKRGHISEMQLRLALTTEALQKDNDYNSLSALDDIDQKVLELSYEKQHPGVDVSDLGEAYQNGAIDEKDYLDVKKSINGKTDEEANSSLVEQQFKKEFGVNYNDFKGAFRASLSGRLKPGDSGYISVDDAYKWRTKASPSSGDDWVKAQIVFNETGYEYKSTGSASYYDGWATKETKGTNTLYDEMVADPNGAFHNSPKTFGKVFNALNDASDVGEKSTSNYTTVYKGEVSEVLDAQTGVLDILNGFLDDGTIDYPTAYKIWTEYKNYSVYPSGAIQYLHKP